MTDLESTLAYLYRFGLMLGVVGAVACGPPGPGPAADPDGSSSSSSSSSVDDSTSTGTSTDTTTETSEDTTGTLESGLTFVPMDGDVVYVDPCDPIHQDCPEGEKCVAYASTGGYWNNNKCVVVAGDQPAGSPCSYGGPIDATDNCDVDSQCWDVQEIDGEWSGVCRAFCMGTIDAPECTPDSPESCLVLGDGAVTVCVPSCDPLAQDCDAGYGCFWGYSDFMCAISSDNVPIDVPCGFMNDCQAGTLCANAEVLPGCQGASCCTPFCDVTLGDAQCEGLLGTSCVIFFEEAPPGGEDIGICASL